MVLHQLEAVIADPVCCVVLRLSVGLTAEWNLVQCAHNKRWNNIKIKKNIDLHQVLF